MYLILAIHCATLYLAAKKEKIDQSINNTVHYDNNDDDIDDDDKKN